MATEKTPTNEVPPPQMPTTLKRWYQDREAIESLRAIMDDPAFQKAIALLKNECLPSGNRLKADTQINNNAHAWLAGYCDAFNDLGKLTMIPSKTNPTQLEEWTP